MTLRTVTAVYNAPNVRSNDLVAGADLSATIADGDTFTIVAPAAAAGNEQPTIDTNQLLIVASFAGTTTLTFTAGSYPPSLRSGLGNLATLNGVNAEVRWMMLEAGRFIIVTSGVMSINGTNAGGNVKMAAYILPIRGFVTTSNISGLSS